MMIASLIIRSNEKSKLMVVTRKKTKPDREIKIFLNNKILPQSENMKYMGILIDKRFSFKSLIDLTTEKCSKLIFALSKSAKIN
ncbi:hypothetical protein C0J52_21339 [Blattella germanica]|nr:hypothetical protein C0J52_21339 [Blattella germanica]